MSGRFLSLEGVEGVGKTTNLAFIVSWLENRGIDVVQTREPGGTDVGERIRSVLLDPETEIAPETELLLMFACRAELVRQIIRPALARGCWVVCDRFTDASFAYQGGGRGLGFERVAQIERWALGDFRPDLTLFLDLPVETGLERVGARDNRDRIEREAEPFFIAVRNAYLKRIELDSARFRVIDASCPLEEVQHQIRQVLSQQLELSQVVDAMPGRS